MPFPAEGSFSLDNVNGQIEIHGSDRDTVSIHAVIHGSDREKVDAVEVKVDSGTNEIKVHTLQPSDINQSLGSWITGNSLTVDYIIQIPQRAHLTKISSVNGRLAIDGVAGSIAATTVNGKLQVKEAANNLKLSTVNGLISAELLALSGSQSVSINTTNGVIELGIPSNADATVSGNTVNGRISSGFPSLIVKKRFPISSNLNGKLGSGSATVKVATVNGFIQIHPEPTEK